MDARRRWVQSPHRQAPGAGTQETQQKVTVEKTISSEVNTMEYQTEISSLCVTGESSHFDMIFREDCHPHLLFQAKDIRQKKK